MTGPVSPPALSPATAASPGTGPFPGVRFSVLDRSRVREGRPVGEALRDTVALAREAEALGYHRFWVAEHHGVPGVAGSAPTVLAAAVASATSRVRVGTGGVMLPNHQPLVVAEQFGVLESLFPGRIDMGLGRSVGFTDGVRKALGRGKEEADAFAERLAELLGYFDGPAPSGVRARPADAVRVPAFVLATGAGARTAAAAGLPLVIGGPRREKLAEAARTYREEFRPGPWAAAPYVVVSGEVALARDEDSARRLLLPEAWAMSHARTHGTFPPLEAAARIEAMELPERQRGLLEKGLDGGVYGTEEQVVERLGGLIEATGAQEVLVTTSTYDRAGLLDSYRRLARLAGIVPAGGG
ncbi:MsnO8 family LLM class oxidoreductase [Streptomyces albidoflavus]